MDHGNPALPSSGSYLVYRMHHLVLLAEHSQLLLLDDPSGMDRALRSPQPKSHFK
jgi:hypothetical protein